MATGNLSGRPVFGYVIATSAPASGVPSGRRTVPSTAHSPGLAGLPQLDVVLDLPLVATEFPSLERLISPRLDSQPVFGPCLGVQDGTEAPGPGVDTVLSPPRDALTGGVGHLDLHLGLVDGTSGLGVEQSCPRPRASV